MEKIRSLALVAILVILPFLIYYPYKAFSWQLKMAFFEPERWFRSGWADADAVISPLTRLVYFAMWSPAVIAGIAALLFGLRIAVLFRRGVIFDPRVATAILRMGWCTVVSNLIHISAACSSPMVVSWHNAAGPLPLRLWLSTPHVSLILCGLAFVLMGAVLREAIRIDQDNRMYV